MKSNIVLKGAAVLIIVILVVVIAKGRKADDVAAVVNATSSETADLSSVESGPSEVDNGLAGDLFEDEFLEDEYGVDVDSPVETMRTLTKETRAVREDSVKLQDKNKELQQNVQRLLEMEDTINKRVNSRFTKSEQDAENKRRELEETQELTRNLISELQGRLEKLQQADKKKGGAKTAGGYEIGAAGIPTGLGYDENGMSVDFDEVVWANPIDAKVDERDPNKISLPDFGGGAKETIKDIAKATGNSDKLKESRLIKAYTIPENSTLLGSVSMTAMLGRIPTGGQVIDPYPFKVMVGEENLSSNGINIPGVVGIKMSGVAKGDWTLSCVSGEIRSMTFTFRDGTIQTIPEPGTQATDPLAWFSDKNGVPCITGKRITNAASYLGQRVLLTTAAGYAEAEAATQITTQTTSSGGINSAVTGDPRTVAENMAISEGLSEVTDWLDARQESSFDAVYVPPGTELAIHVNEELKIDYDPEGRKVNHYADFEGHSKRHLD